MRNILSLIILLVVLTIWVVDAQYNIITREFSALGIENVHVSTNPGNIEVRTWSKSKIEIKVFAKNNRSAYDVDDLVVEKSGEDIEFYFEINNNWNSNIKLVINSPAEMNFMLESTSGNISIEDDIKGNLEIQTDGGHISFQDVNGKVIAKTSGGHITGKNIYDVVELHSDGGHITLENINNGQANVSTYGGHITIGNVKSNLEATTHGGNIVVKNVGGSANVLTYGGKISLKKVSGNATMETYGGNLYLFGATGNVKASTMGGNIKLDDITGSIIAETRGGNIQAKLNPSRNSESSLETTGNISIMLPNNAKTEIKINVDNYEAGHNVKRFLISDFKTELIDVDEDMGELNAKCVLNGGGSKIKIYSSDGRVKIKKWKK